MALTFTPRTRECRYWIEHAKYGVEMLTTEALGHSFGGVTADELRELAERILDLTRTPAERLARFEAQKRKEAA